MSKASVGDVAAAPQVERGKRRKDGKAIQACIDDVAAAPQVDPISVTRFRFHRNARELGKDVLGKDVLGKDVHHPQMYWPRW